MNIEALIFIGVIILNVFMYMEFRAQLDASNDMLIASMIEHQIQITRLQQRVDALTVDQPYSSEKVKWN